MTDAPLPVFDGHNDLLLRLWRAAPAERDALWLDGDGEGHLDLPRMRSSGFAGGLFAIYVPSPHPDGDVDALMDAPPYDLPLPAPIPADHAQPVALAMAGILMRMQRVSDGALRLCRSAADIRGCLADGTVAAVMHMEGAEAIGADLDALHVLHAAGLRSLGPVWSRPTIFGHGVPFRYPGDPDTGPGLTPRRPQPRRALRRAPHPHRPVASEREGFRRGGGDLHRAARRHPLERPRRHPLDPQPHRPPAQP